MDRINFQNEFTKVARKQGLGETVNSCIVCYQAREVLKKLFINNEINCESYKDGILIIKFKSSAGLARFGMIKLKFVDDLNLKLEKNDIKIATSAIKTLIN